MGHGHGLVNQSLNSDKVALGTLAARTAVILTTQFANPTSSSFLMKRVRYFLSLVGRTAADDGPILIGCANGDATVSEISAAMVERNTNGPDDITSMLDQDTAWVVYQNTVVPLVIRAALTEGETSGQWINFGGRNGIPAIEGSGMVVFAFNAGSNVLTTGSTVNGIIMLQGVWLRD